MSCSCKLQVARKSARAGESTLTVIQGTGLIEPLPSLTPEFWDHPRHWHPVGRWKRARSWRLLQEIFMGLVWKCTPDLCPLPLTTFTHTAASNSKWNWKMGPHFMPGKKKKINFVKSSPILPTKYLSFLPVH